MARPRAVKTADVHPRRRLSTEELRKELYPIAREFAGLDQPSESLLDRAIEFGPRGRGGAWVIPEVDAQAVIARLEELEEELEGIGIALLAEQRLGQPTAEDELLPIEDLARRFGLDELL